MIGILSRYFSNDGFMPHIHCYLDRSNLVWTMVLTDSLIGISYVVISATLYSLVRKTKLPFHSVFLAFGLFILACGATHFLEIYNLWIPNYWLSASVKLVTAAASVTTAIYLLKLFSKIVELTQTARDITRTEDKIEENLLRKISTPPEVKNLLVRTTFIPLAFAFVLVTLSIIQTKHLSELQYSVEHSDEIIKRAYRVGRFATNAQMDLRGFWFTDLTKFLHSGDENQEGFETEYTTLKTLASDEVEQSSRLKELGNILLDWKEFKNNALVELPDSSHRKNTFQSFDLNNSSFIKKTTDAVERFLEAERELRTARSHRTRIITNYFIVFIGAVTFFLLGIFGVFGRSSFLKLSTTFGLALEAAKQSQDKLRKAVSIRDDFVSIASHELKTPLTTLKLQLEMLRRRLKASAIPGQNDEKFSKMLEISNAQVSRIQMLIDDLLDVSKISAGKLQFQMEEVNLSQLVTEVVERHNESSSTGALQIKLEIPTENVMVFCDRFRIDQVLTNLLSNAVKYGDRKPILVRLETFNQQARILVRDQGIGISKEKQEKIYDRYERAVETNNIPGLGLGLFIVREIIRSHHGTIRVESELGNGATFFVELPLRDEDLVLTFETQTSVTSTVFSVRESKTG